MGMDLIAWKLPGVATEEAAAALLDRFYAGDEDAFEPSEDVRRFHNELLARYPALGSFPVEHMQTAATHWSTTPEPSDRVIVMHLQWRVPDGVLEGIVALARTHGLMLYDPQGPTLHPPEGDPGPMRRDPLVLRSALLGTLYGVVILAAGVLVPIPVLDWLAIGVGGFLAVMGVYGIGSWLRE